jgi:predicted ribosome-associated RNA-binding protein Tma20
MDLIAFVLGLAIGGFVGFKVAEYIHTTIFKDILMKLKVSEEDMKSMLKDLQQDLPEEHEDAMPRIEVKVEKVNEQLYVYRLDTDEFLCQGADREAVLASLAKRFNKDFKIVLTEEHGAQYLKESPTS